MARLFFYQDSELFCHHSFDTDPNPEDFYMHAHERIELFYFLSGHAQYLVEGSEYELHPGDLMLMGLAEGHKLQLLSNEPYERIVIHFAPSVLTGIDPEGLLLRPFVDKPLGQRNHYRSDRFPEIFSGFDMNGSSAQIRLHMLITLLNVLQELSVLSSGQPDAPEVEDSAAHQLLQYVNAHLFEDISLSSLSRTFFLSPSQLNRIFRNAAGASVGSYIRVKRLLAARERILSGESPMASSAACGFKDYSAFFRAYKVKFGHAPSLDSQKP